MSDLGTPIGGYGDRPRGGYGSTPSGGYGSTPSGGYGTTATGLPTFDANQGAAAGAFLGGLNNSAANTGYANNTPYTAPTSNPLDAIYAQLQAQYAPQASDLNFQFQQAYGTGLARDAYYNQQNQFANQTYQNGLRNLGIQQAYNNTDANIYRQNMGLYQQMADLAGQTMGLDQSLHPLNAQELANNLAKIGLQQTQQTQAANSQAVAGGFGTAPGVQTGLNQINTAADQARTGANIASQQQDIGISKSVIGDKTDMLRDQERMNLQRADLEHLNQKAEELGVDRDNLYLSLQKGLASTGLDRMTNIGSILSMSRSTDAQQRALGQQLISQLYQAAQTGMANGTITPDQVNSFVLPTAPGQVGGWGMLTHGLGG